MKTQTYTEIMDAARTRYVELTTELKAIEKAFPGIGALGTVASVEHPRGVRATRKGTWTRTPEQRAAKSAAMKAAWARRKANGATHDTPGTTTDSQPDTTLTA